MKANLNELRELVVFSEDKNTNLRGAMIVLMNQLIVEPVNQGVYESDKFDAYFFQKNDDILEGIDFLEEIGTDMNEEIELDLF